MSAYSKPKHLKPEFLAFLSVSKTGAALSFSVMNETETRYVHEPDFLVKPHTSESVVTSVLYDREMFSIQLSWLMK